MSKERNIRKTELFEDQLEGLFGDVRCADEFIKGAEWVLCRNSWEGSQIGPAASVWFLPMEEVPGMPLVVIYYCFDDQYVWFLCVEIV